MFPLIDYPELSLLHPDVLFGLEGPQLDKRVIRMKARIVRSFEGFSDVDRIFVTKIGCEFVNPQPLETQLISKYVSRYARNLIYFLKWIIQNTLNAAKKQIKPSSFVKRLGFWVTTPICK